MTNAEKAHLVSRSRVRQASGGGSSTASSPILRHPKYENVTVSIELIGPDEATDFLIGNVKNRSKKKARVAEYARSMASGRWNEQNLSQIVIDRNGHLKNGQNRMWAVIESGESCWFLVVRGVDRGVMTSLDTGTSRSLSDVLDMRGGYKSTSALAAAIRCCYEYERRGRQLKGSDQSRQSHDEALEFLDDHPEIPEWSLWTKNIHGRMKGMQKVVKGSELALFAYALDQGGSDRQDITEFIEAVAGIKPASGAVLILQAKLQDMQHEKLTKGRSYGRDFVMAIFVKAWNSYLAGEEITRLSWRAGGARPEVFPSLIFSVE